MTTQDIISLPVISIYDQKILGVVTNVYVYRKRIIALLVVDENNYDEFILFTKNIYKQGAKAIIVTTATKLQLKDSIQYLLDKYCLPLGNLAFDINGNDITTLANIIFDSHFKVISVQCNNIEYIRDIISFKTNCTILNTYHKQIKISQEKIFNENAENKDIVVKVQSKKSANPKLNTPLSLLVGKTCTKNIFASNGEVILKKDTKITSSIVAKLSGLGKLNELLLNSN
ncbi:MAG: hypothetical protein IK070_00565 [Clostridia bacterium]|nr:hypothetical protein [Clostridia bacterium]